MTPVDADLVLVAKAGIAKSTIGSPSSRGLAFDARSNIDAIENLSKFW
jgi:hypothetical protein